MLIPKEDASGIIYEATYTLDDTGRREGILESYRKRGGGQETRLITYDYNDHGRLTEESYDISGATEEMTYKYDQSGNRTEEKVRDGSGTTTTVYTYNDLDQLLTESRGGEVTSYEYDKAGNLTAREVDGATTTCRHDHLNRLREASGPEGTNWSVGYGYDYRGNRLYEANNGSPAVRFSGVRAGSFLPSAAGGLMRCLS